MANYSSRGIEIFIPESRILSLLRHLSNSVTLFILVGITMCVKARAYKWWTVLKGKWTGHVIVLSRRNPRDTYPKHVSRSRDWAGVPACLVRTRMEDLLVLIWKRGRFSNETEQEEYFRKFSMIWPRVKGKRVASLKKFNGAKFRL